MIPVTLTEIAAATDGRLDTVADPGQTITGSVVADSRSAGAGGLFVAVPGARVDGHDFAGSAVDAGAFAVLAQRPVGVPAIIVDDTVRALGELARTVLGRLKRLDPPPTVVGVTGSSGKTSTKDLLAQVLALRGPVVAPPGSYNTEIGVPLTILSADASTRTLVLEMGARGAGHIAYLCQLATPTIGVVLNVGTAHIGEFGDRDAIASAKAELIEALPDNGVAVLGGDDPVVRRMAERTSARTVLFGESVHADVRAEDVSLDQQGRASFRLVTPDGTAPVTLKLVGEHQVANALAAAAVAGALELAVDDVATALTQAQALSRWRMDVTERSDGVTVINDAYNANPESMRAAVDTLLAVGRGRRTWAVLGEMRELGDTSDAEHEALGQLAVRVGVDRLVAVGELARAIQRGARVSDPSGETTSEERTSGRARPSDPSGEPTWVPDGASALELLREQIAPGDVVLVKASRAAGLEGLADALASEEVAAR